MLGHFTSSPTRGPHGCSSFLFLVAMPGAPSSFLFLVVAMPGAPSSFLFLVAMPGAPSSFLFLVAMPGAPSSFEPVPSSDARGPCQDQPSVPRAGLECQRSMEVVEM